MLVAQLVNEVAGKKSGKRGYQAELEPVARWTDASSSDEPQVWTGSGRNHFTTQSLGANTFAHRVVDGRRTIYFSL